MNGVLFINKPEGWTSRDVVNKVSHLYNTKKVGHTGTLDPIATGVLIVCLGSYTKLVDELTSSEKTYQATMSLGVKTDTGDITGNVIKESKKDLSEELIRKTFANFPQEYTQTVPIYSAVKVNGQKLYEYARKGELVELPKRQVKIKNLKILNIKDHNIDFSVTVSKGTYIRSLIEDLANNMFTYACMRSLVRTYQGNVSLNDCFKIEEISEKTPLKTLEDLLTYPKIELSQEEVKKVENGQRLKLKTNEERVFLLNNQEVIAIYEKIEDKYRMIFKTI